MVAVHVFVSQNAKLHTGLKRPTLRPRYTIYYFEPRGVKFHFRCLFSGRKMCVLLYLTLYLVLQSSNSKILAISNSKNSISSTGARVINAPRRYCRRGPRICGVKVKIRGAKVKFYQTTRFTGNTCHFRFDFQEQKVSISVEYGIKKNRCQFIGP